VVLGGGVLEVDVGYGWLGRFSAGGVVGVEV